MRKGWIVLLTAVLVVAFAAPAMADLKVTGFYRAKAMMSNFFDGSKGPSVRYKSGSNAGVDEEQNNAYVEQRARLKFDMGTENARAIFHFESDMNWGKESGTVNRNHGGALSGDSVQLETKNVYVWFKIPDTSVTASVGLQPLKDHYAGIFSNSADMTGIFAKGKLEPVKWTLGWAKLYENDYQQTDDVSLYVAAVEFVPSKDMNLGLNFYWVKDDSGRADDAQMMMNPLNEDASAPFAFTGSTTDVYMPGVNFSMNAGIAKISAFAFYQFGSFDSTIGGEDIDISAYMLDLRADVKVGPGNFFVEGFYISGDDKGDEYNSPIVLGDYQTQHNTGSINGTGGNSGFGRTNMYFLFGADSLNVSQCLIGCSGGEYGDSFGNTGHGLWHIAAGYSQKFTAKLKGAVNLGYVAAVEKGSGFGSAKDDESMGTEANVRLDYDIQKGLQFSLVGAWLKLGDFAYDEGANNGNIEDSYWMGYARLAYSF